MRFPRHARIFRGQLDAAPFAGVFVLLLIFLVFNASLVFTPGVPVNLPMAADLPGTTNLHVAVTVDASGQFYFGNQAIQPKALLTRLRAAVRQSNVPLTLLVFADKSVRNETLVHLYELAHKAGIQEGFLATRPPLLAVPTNAVPTSP